MLYSNVRAVVQTVRPEQLVEYEILNLHLSCTFFARIAIILYFCLKVVRFSIFYI